MRRAVRGYLAECLELDAAATGATREQAIESLRVELKERVARVEGVAPPSGEEPVEVDIVTVEGDAVP